MISVIIMIVNLRITKINCDDKGNDANIPAENDSHNRPLNGDCFGAIEEDEVPSNSPI